MTPSDQIMVKLRVLMTQDGRLAADPLSGGGSANIKAIELLQERDRRAEGLPALYDAAGGSLRRMEGARSRFHAEGFLGRLASIDFQAFDANCRRHVTITTAAVVMNSTQGLTNQPR